MRLSLKVDKISIWGISYGSHLAFEYIRLFENAIDKMVVVSLEGPNKTIKLPKSTEEFFFRLAELAATNFGNTTVYPNLESKIQTVHEQIKKNPVTAIYKNRSGSVDTVGISNFELQSAIATFYLKNPSVSKKLAKIFSQMYDGDFSEIASDVMIMKRYAYPGVQAMPFAMDMQSGISKDRNDMVMQQLPNSILASSIDFLLFEWMSEIDFPALDNVFRTLKANHVKPLLFSGTLDGRTYLSSAKEIAKHFKNGKHRIIENAGRDLFMATPEVGQTIF